MKPAREKIVDTLLSWLGPRDRVDWPVEELVLLCTGASTCTEATISRTLDTAGRFGFLATLRPRERGQRLVTLGVLEPRFGGVITARDRAPYRDSRVAPLPRKRVEVAPVADSILSSLRGGAKTRLEPGTTYRVLSVRGPWAWSIFCAGKDIENRSWTTPH
ncbi:MAG: hypothetical protein ABI445_19720, partial [Polyangia bacterium]